MCVCVCVCVSVCVCVCVVQLFLNSYMISSISTKNKKISKQLYACKCF